MMNNLQAVSPQLHHMCSAISLPAKWRHGGLRSHEEVRHHLCSAIPLPKGDAEWRQGGLRSTPEVAPR